MSHQQVALHLWLMPLLLPRGPETQSLVLLWRVWAELEPLPWRGEARALGMQGWSVAGRSFPWGGLSALQVEVPLGCLGVELTERLHWCRVLRVS